MDEMPVVAQMEGYEARAAEWGEYSAVFESAAAGTDPSPLFKGLPDDRCQCHHYGYLLKGKMLVRYGDREETITAGQAYYIEPGHVPLVIEDAESIEFTRTEELQQTIQVAMKNMEAAEGS